MSLNIKTIRDSFELAKPIAKEVIDSFYDNLFSDYPGSDALFAGVEMEKQKTLLINSLVYIVDHLDSPQSLEKYLHNMGARHVGYKTEAEHYQWVAASMLKAFGQHFGEKWTDELNDEWTKALTVVAEIMLEGAQRELDKNKDDANSQNTNDNVVKLESVSPESGIRQMIRAEVRGLIAEIIKEEVALAVTEELKNFNRDSIIQEIKKAI